RLDASRTGDVTVVAADQTHIRRVVVKGHADVPRVGHEQGRQRSHVEVWTHPLRRSLTNEQRQTAENDSRSHRASKRGGSWEELSSTLAQLDGRVCCFS